MNVGAITQYIDVAQIVLYAFWIFFIGLIIYLRREDKREGYPLESDRSARTDRVKIVGFPGLPSPKVFRLADGSSVTVPAAPATQPPLAATPVEPWPGAPLVPDGDPLTSGVGPGSWVPRADKPDLTLEGHARIVPLRVATDFGINERDPDPRGMPVLAGDDQVAGTVHDVWVDRAEPQIRYLEVQLEGSGQRALLPITFARFDDWKRCVRVQSILAGQFGGVPRLAQADQVTRLEEERISAYYAAGTLYAEPARMGPLL
jgi:photosynthetic reaction center H subunit